MELAEFKDNVDGFVNVMFKDEEDLRSSIKRSIINAKHAGYKRYVAGLVPRIIENVIFNPPATIVYWYDESKTVVKCGEGDDFDPEKGLAMAISKKFFGNGGNYYNEFKKWLPEEKKELLDNGGSISKKIEQGVKDLNTRVKEAAKNFKVGDNLNKEIYTTKQLAEKLGIDPRSIARKAARGDFEQVAKVNGEWRIWY